MQLHRAREQFQDANLVLIGMGTPRQATWFANKFAPGMTVLADEARASYKALKLKVGSGNDLVGPKSVVAGLRHGRRSGVVQGRPVGNVKQLGGSLVVAPGGEVLFEHRSTHAGDTAEVDELLAALRA